MKPAKSCPIVVREVAGMLLVLAFRHPLAGCQLVKGTIDDGEDAAAAAVRELKEESGVVAEVVSALGIWPSGHQEQIWSFHLCRPSVALPETWSHWCHDDCGHDFQFFWHPLMSEPSADWHPVHAGALAFVRNVLSKADSIEQRTLTGFEKYGKPT